MPHYLPPENPQPIRIKDAMKARLNEHSMPPLRRCVECNSLMVLYGTVRGWACPKCNPDCRGLFMNKDELIKDALAEYLFFDEEDIADDGRNFALIRYLTIYQLCGGRL